MSLEVTGRTRMQRRRRRAAASHRQRQQAEQHGHDGAGAVDLRQSEPGRAERAHSEGGDAISELVAGITPLATDAEMVISRSCPKLIVSGSSAEQPRPARPNA